MVTMVTVYGYHGNNVWLPWLLCMGTVYGYHSYCVWLPWLLCMVTIVTMCGYHGY